jgi:aryl-alcohol dehydrogenase-like predicted oxidoreductase
MGERDATRREFLERAGGVLAAAGALLPRASHAATQALPRRTLGRTGREVSCVVFGCGSRFLAYEPDAAQEILARALALGINYLDTAVGYGNGESESRVGRFLEGRRDQVFLATKVPERSRTRDAALREVEGSLKRLRTDHVDLLHVHSLGGPSDLTAIEAPDGVLKALYELRDQKVARAIGISSHTDGAVMAQAIEHNDLDCVQMALNAARASRFEDLALPAAQRKKLGVIGMKVMAQEKLLGTGPGTAEPAMLLRYVLGLPVSAAVVGMPHPEHLEQNVRVAEQMAPLNAKERDELARRVAPAQQSLERHFVNHADTGWA